MLKSVLSWENAIDESKEGAADGDKMADAGYQGCHAALKGHLSDERK